MNDFLDPLAIALASIIQPTISEKRPVQVQRFWTKIWIGLFIVLVVTLLVLLFGTFFSGWEKWTGFKDNNYANWVQMLFGPVVIVLIVVWLSDLIEDKLANSSSPGSASASLPVGMPQSIADSLVSSFNSPPQSSQVHISRPRRRAVLGLAAISFILVSGTTALTWDFLTKGKSSAHLQPTTPNLQPPGTLINMYQKHRGEVKAVAWSQDGTRIASGSADRTVQIWDAMTGNNAIICFGHTDEVKTVAWHPGDKRRLASGSLDKTIRIWDVVSGEQLKIYGGFTGVVRSVAWSPDGRFIAGGAGDAAKQPDSTVHVWDTSSSSDNPIFIYKGHSKQVITIAWSPDGTRIASASFDKNVKVWDALTGYLHFSIEHPSGVRGVAWSPDGRYIASSDQSGTVRIWDANMGELVYNPYQFQPYSGPGRTKEIQSVSWSPDGKYLAAGGFDWTVHIWDFYSGRTLYIYTRHKNQVWDVAWSPNGQYIASASIDGTVQVWWGM